MTRLFILSTVAGLLSGCAFPGDYVTRPVEVRSVSALTPQTTAYFARPYASASLADVQAFARARPDSIPPKQHYSAPIGKQGEFSLLMDGYMRAVLVWILPPLPIPVHSEVLLRLGSDPAQTYVLSYSDTGRSAKVYQFDHSSKELKPATTISVTRTERTRDDPINHGRQEHVNVLTVQSPR